MTEKIHWKEKRRLLNEAKKFALSSIAEQNISNDLVRLDELKKSKEEKAKRKQEKVDMISKYLASKGWSRFGDKWRRVGFGERTLNQAYRIQVKTDKSNLLVDTDISTSI